jgi:hypothetical protein
VLGTAGLFAGFTTAEELEPELFVNVLQLEEGGAFVVGAEPTFGAGIFCPSHGTADDGIRFFWRLDLRTYDLDDENEALGIIINALSKNYVLVLSILLKKKLFLCLYIPFFKWISI